MTIKLDDIPIINSMNDFYWLSIGQQVRILGSKNVEVYVGELPDDFFRILPTTTYAEDGKIKIKQMYIQEDREGEMRRVTCLGTISQVDEKSFEYLLYKEMLEATQ